MSQPPPPCPNCGQPATEVSVRPYGGALSGDYLCSAGHIWTTHWMEA